MSRVSVPLLAVVKPVNPPTATLGAGTVDANDVLRVRPVTTAEYLLGTRDEGIVELAGGTRARRVRLQYLDNIELRPETGLATVTVSYPREEIRHIPIQAF